jgi:hypothetical protein
LSIGSVFWPMAMHRGTELQGWIETALMVTFIVGAVVIVSSAAIRCVQTLRGVPPPSATPAPIESGKVTLEPAAPFRCC